MKPSMLFPALAVLAMCLSAEASPQPFTIPLPAGPSETEFFNGGAGDMYYTVGKGGKLFGVNLTSQKLQFTLPFPDSAGQPSITAIFPCDVPGGLVLVEVGSNSDVMAVNGMGQLLWLAASFPLPGTRANSYTVIDGILFVASDRLASFVAVALLNGTVLNTFSIVRGNVFSNYAILTVQPPDSQQPLLVNFALPSLQQIWSFRGASAFIAANEKYLLIENKTANGEDSQVVVLDARTFHKVHVLDAMNGIVTDNFPPMLRGTTLICELGLETVRIAAFNILTGVEYFQIYVGEPGEGAAGITVIGDLIVTTSQLVLSIINASSGQLIVTANNVPYLPTPQISAAGLNTVLVGNLQGYTLWNAAGQCVGRNEQSPGTTASPINVYVWKQTYDVTTVGASVVGTPI